MNFWIQICYYHYNKKDAWQNILFIDKMIMRQVKIRKQYLSMVWIDYKKAYDMVPHLWIIDCLEIAEINKIFEDFGRKYEIMACRSDEWRGKLRRSSDEEFFKATLCPHCYLLCVCYHLYKL